MTCNVKWIIWIQYFVADTQVAETFPYIYVHMCVVFMCYACVIYSVCHMSLSFENRLSKKKDI